MTPTSSARSPDTGDALIRAALRLFGEQGYDATSTREIAAAAGANVASISYHFGGKEGLRAACGDFIIGRMGSVMAAAFDIGDPGAPSGLTPQEASLRLVQICERMTQALNGEEGRLLAPFMLREITSPSSLIDTIYEGMIGPVHQRLCRLWADATGAPHDAPETLLRVFSLVGQIVYFALARRIVLKRMGWDDFGASEAATLTSVLRANVEAIIADATVR